VLKEIDRYKKKNSIVAEVAIKKFLGHIWYLSEELLAFAFFDDRVSTYQLPSAKWLLLCTKLASNIH